MVCGCILNHKTDMKIVYIKESYDTLLTVNIYIIGTHLEKV